MLGDSAFWDFSVDKQGEFHLFLLRSLHLSMRPLCLTDPREVRAELGAKLSRRFQDFIVYLKSKLMSSST